MFRSVIALSSRLCTSSIIGIERFAARNFSVHTIVSKSFVAYRNPAVKSSVYSRIVSTVFERSAVCGNASALVQCRWKGGNKKALKTRQAAAKRFIVTGSGKPYLLRS